MDRKYYENSNLFKVINSERQPFNVLKIHFYRLLNFNKPETCEASRSATLGFATEQGTISSDDLLAKINNNYFVTMLMSFSLVFIFCSTDFTNLVSVGLQLLPCSLNRLSH